VPGATAWRKGAWYSLAVRTLRASFLALAIVTVGCGRGGLGDFDVDGETGVEEDTATDTGVIDTGEPDTWVEPPYDTDVPPYDTWVPPYDTGVLPYDTWVPPYDSWVPPPDSWVGWDTGVYDTWVPPPDTWVPPPDTWVPPPDSFPIDTGVFDTGIDTGPPEGGILCGGDYCDALTQQCCAGFTGLSCVAKGKCSGGTTLSCSSAASCTGGEVCCFGGLTGGTPSATCQPFCLGIVLCASNDECPPMQTCQNTFGGYRICR